ncbi:COMM domain-containing protein 3 [Aphelenchoides bicaudatus]|nr:COMM domain-containing protein 3 [Aphelenchoides bicaudatus]
MAIPNNLIQKLKSLETNSYDKNYLERLCKCVVDSFLDETKNVDRETFPNEIVSIVGTIIIRAASLNLEPIDLKQNLFDQTSNEYLIGNALLNAYSERYKDLVDGPLKTISWKYPQLVDIDWRLSGVMESDSELGIKEPLAEFVFTSLETDETKTKDFTFVCTKQQLQDMQWKVKEAHNLLQKMASQ